MPELPEAETIVRGLRGPLTGARIARTRVLRPDLLDTSPGRFARLLKGRAVLGVSRRGKNVVLELVGPAWLVVNLGMTGGLFPLAPRERSRQVTHPGVRFYLEGGGQLVYNDVRRFGQLRVMNAESWAAFSGRLGPEPLGPDFHRADFRGSLAASRTPIRSWLLDQRKVAGVGNIYAVEACYRAGIDPRRPANALNPDEAETLHRAIVQVLDEAVRARGTTLRDYRDPEGEGGAFGPRLRVYGREDLPCGRCGTPVDRVVFGNRSAFLCPTCQT